MGERSVRVAIGKQPLTDVRGSVNDTSYRAARVSKRFSGTTKTRRGGQATLEFALMWAGVIVPMTFGIIFTAEMYWVWHAMVEFTRDGARYAATHCWEADGQNVISYMQSNVPLTMDLNQFQSGGSATINVNYYQIDPNSGQLQPFTSCSADCSTTCVPDSVTISISNYTFGRFVGYLKLPPVTMPAFPTSMPIESNGCDPEQGTCNP